MFDVFNKYRNNDGYIVLNKIPNNQVHERVKGFDAYEVNGDIYLYKANIWTKPDIRELINEEIAKQAGCRNAEYDLAIYNGEKGLITKYFIKPNEEYLSGKELLYKASFDNGDNTLYSYILALKKIGIPQNIIEIKTRELLEYHIVDIFTIQNDRHYGNIAFLKKDDTISLAPRFDNEDSLIAEITDTKRKEFNQSRYKMQIIRDELSFISKTKKTEVFRLLSPIIPADPIIDYWETISWETIPIVKRKEILDKERSLFPNTYTLDTYEMIRRKMQTMDSYIAKASRVNFNEIYYIFNQYNIKLSDMLKNYYQELYETRVEMFFDQESKIKTR